MTMLPGAITGARIVGERLVHSQQQDPEGRMPLMGHIRELRNRVVKMALALVAGMTAGFILGWPATSCPRCRSTAGERGERCSTCPSLSCWFSR